MSAEKKTDSGGQVCRICKSSQTTSNNGVHRHCNCYYHYECLKKYVNNTRRSSCPHCNRTFTNCKMEKVSPSFGEFLCSPESVLAITILLLTDFYIAQIFLIIFSEYSLSVNSSSKILQVLIFFPGVIFLTFFILSNIMFIFIFRQQYQVWKEQNYTLQMIWLQRQHFE